MHILLAPSRYDGSQEFNSYGAYVAPLGTLSAIDEMRALATGICLRSRHHCVTECQRSRPVVFFLGGFVPGARELPGLYRQ